MALHLAIFVLVVGIGSTIVLDLWAQFTGKIGWIPGTHWPSVGRWLLGIPAGRLVANGQGRRPFTTGEAVAGWVFHYAVGLAYAVMFPLFWGTGFISAPRVWPFVIIGVLVSTLAGLMVLMPGMGGGFFARKLPNTAGIILYVVIAHVVFAVAQYLLAELIS